MMQIRAAVRRFQAAPVILALVLLPACSRGGDSRRADGFYQGPGTKKMQERLEAIVAGMKPFDNPFLNGARAEAVRAQLEGVVHPGDYLDWQPKLAIELLNAGRTEEAIRELDRLVEFMSRKGIETGFKSRHYIERYRAVAWLRLGEQENCLLNHSAESCLMPIRGSGVHQLQRGSREAIRVLLGILERLPDDLEARWLLNLAYMTVGEYPDKVPPQFLIPPRVFEPEHDVGRFPDIAPAIGLDVDGLAGGSVAEDFDNDGDLDLMASEQAFRGPLRLFLNHGDGTFSERSREAGLTGEVGGLNILATDYNNDGFTDIQVLRGGWMMEGGRFPKSLLRNNGDGTFDDVAFEAGVATEHPSQTAAWFDYDGDGRLDIYVGNESNEVAAHACELFHNNGDGTFTDCASAAGVAVFGVVKAVTAGDYNNDGRPDLYVSRRGRPNVLLRNDGAGRGGGRCGWVFTDVTDAAGVGEPVYSFPTWFFDYDNDGWLDLFVSGYEFNGPKDVAADYLGLPHTAERPRLYRNRGDGTFADVTKATGMWRVLHTMGSNYGDLDNDGWLDFYLGTGDPFLGTLIPNRLFRNDAGRRFQDVTTSAGVGHLQKGHGVSFADFDNDGDQDIYEVMGGAFEGDTYRNVLYENPGHGHHWLTLKFEGVKSNRPGFGTRVVVVVDDPAGERSIHRVVGTGGSFGGNPFRMEVGLGPARAVKRVEVWWPASGIRQTLTGLEMDRAWTIREDAKTAEPLALKSFRFATGGAPNHPHH